MSKQGTEFPSATNISNSTSEVNEPRLKETGEIENIDSRDVLKSRLTNARSVSSNGGTKNNLEDDETNGLVAMKSIFLIFITFF